jgi:Beta-propeller repeat
MLKTRLSKLARISLVALTASGCALAQGTPASKSASQPDPAAKAQSMETYARLPLSFEANQGQTDSRVKFLAQGPGYTLFLTSDEAVLALPAPSHADKPGADRENSPTMAMRLVGANPASRISGLEELEGKSNYFIGNDPAKWRTNIPNYAKVRYREVYPGVDLVYYGSQERVEYDFVVAAGSDPRAIGLAFERASREPTKRVYGAAPLRIDGSGDLLVSFNGSEIRLHKPTAYQLTADHGTTDGNARHLIEASYVLRSNGQVGIRLAPYDTTKALIIDPVLTYASRLGGSNGEINAAIAVDGAGNVYVTGTTESFDFPVVNQIPGACQGSCSTSFDVVYVTKINAAGNALVYSSRIGGSNFDEGFGIAVDSLGNAYLTGLTSSADFPQVNPIPGACLGTCGTGLSQDAFVTKINAAGNALVYSTLLGGSGNDDAFAIAVDGSGNAYLTGQSNSTDFPQVNPIPGACLGTCGTGSFPQDAFVTEVNAAGNALVYSSYLAGSAFTQGFGIAADSAGNAYVVGLTQSADFPRVNQIAGACLGTCGTGANSDGFVTKINAQGVSLAYSSVFGGSGFDDVAAIALDSSGNAYLTGSAGSVDFPQVNPIKKATKGCGTGTGDAFVSKINSAGSALVYSSLVGGQRDDEGTGIAVDSLGNAYLIGFTQSVNFPSVRPIRGACLGTCSKKLAANVFVVNVNAAGSALVYSSVVGGSASDQGHGIAVDSLGNAYLTGFTQSADFPQVNQIPGACLGSCGSPFNQDTFVIKVAP